MFEVLQYRSATAYDPTGDRLLRKQVDDLRVYFEGRRSTSILPRMYLGQYLRAVAIPMWMPAAAVSFLAMWTWRAAPFGPGLCRRCGYNLAGLSSGTPCPECGRPPARS